MEEREMAEKNLILKFLTGSYLYGTNTPASDKDYVGVFIPDRDYVMGLKKCERVEMRTNSSGSGIRNTSADTDCTYYSLPKFIHLAMQCNPNIVELFFAPKKNILVCTTYGQQLLDAAPLFISKRVRHTFMGYAQEQKRKLIYKNPVGSRLEYVEKFGYDVKFASHLIRLLTEGMEFLVEGRVTLPLPNNQLVRDIKEGKHDLCFILGEAEKYEALVEQAYVSSSVQNTPKTKEINDLQISMLKEFWAEHEEAEMESTFRKMTKKWGW